MKENHELINFDGNLITNVNEKYLNFQYIEYNRPFIIYDQILDQINKTYKRRN